MHKVQWHEPGSHRVQFFPYVRVCVCVYLCVGETHTEGERQAGVRPGSRRNGVVWLANVCLYGRILLKEAEGSCGKNSNLGFVPSYFANLDKSLG